MPTTPTYNWPIPAATDYVKDGWDAIADLGNAIDSTVAGLPSAGLTLINSTTLSGTSVNITNVFSSTYRNYKVVLSGSISPAQDFYLRLGTGGTPYSSTGYRWAGYYSYFNSGTGQTYGGTGATGWRAGISQGNLTGSDFTIYAPNVSGYTNYTGFFLDDGGYSYYVGGTLTTTTQYTDLNIYCPNTMSGVIKIYGYKD